MKIQFEKLIHLFKHNNKILCKLNYLIIQLKSEKILIRF